MDEESVVFLTSIELPAFCFVSEAVEWMALGRVPQAMWTEDRRSGEFVDSRFYWREMPDNFEPTTEYPWFERSEFQDLGLPIIEFYFEAAQKCYGEYVRTLPDQISEYERMAPSLIEKEDGTTFDLWQSLADEYRKKLEKLAPFQTFIDQIEAQFRVYYEMAWAKLFPLLARGEIEFTAIDYKKWEMLVEDDEHEVAAIFILVPPSSLSLNFDWSQNKIETSDRKYVSLRVRTNDILRFRDLLLPKGKTTNLERFGSYYVTKSAERPAPKNRRGRPHEMDWGELKNLLAELVRDSLVPATKESCIYELITLAEKRLGQSPSRSSVQRNLKDELGLIYAQK